MNGAAMPGARAGAAFVPLYRRVLGAALDRLPPAVRKMHDHGGGLSTAGFCQIERGKGWAARLIAALFRLPPAGRDVPVRVDFTTVEGEEIWQRDFDGHRLVSRQGILPRRPGWFYERFGAGFFQVEPVVSSEGLELRLRAAAFLGIALPRFLWPDIVGREGVDAEGRFTFFVTIRLPLAGLLVHYHGYLLPLGCRQETAGSKSGGASS